MTESELAEIREQQESEREYYQKRGVMPPNYFIARGRLLAYVGELEERDDTGYISCPFCNEGNFDTIELKHHLLTYCEAFENTTPCYK